MDRVFYEVGRSAVLFQWPGLGGINGCGKGSRVLLYTQAARGDDVLRAVGLAETMFFAP